MMTAAIFAILCSAATFERIDVAATLHLAVFFDRHQNGTLGHCYTGLVCALSVSTGEVANGRAFNLTSL